MAGVFLGTALSSDRFHSRREPADFSLSHRPLLGGKTKNRRTGKTGYNSLRRSSRRRSPLPAVRRSPLRPLPSSHPPRPVEYIMISYLSHDPLPSSPPVARASIKRKRSFKFNETPTPAITRVVFVVSRDGDRSAVRGERLGSRGARDRLCPSIIITAACNVVYVPHTRVISRRVRFRASAAGMAATKLPTLSQSATQISN